MFVSPGLVCNHPETRAAQGGGLHDSPSELVSTREEVDTTGTVVGLVRPNIPAGAIDRAATIEAATIRATNPTAALRAINTFPWNPKENASR